MTADGEGGGGMVAVAVGVAGVVGGLESAAIVSPTSTVTAAIPTSESSHPGKPTAFFGGSGLV